MSNTNISIPTLVDFIKKNKKQLLSRKLVSYAGLDAGQEFPNAKFEPANFSFVSNNYGIKTMDSRGRIKLIDNNDYFGYNINTWKGIFDIVILK